MKIICYDFEIFPFSQLLGTLIIHENGIKELYQTWDPEEMKTFYYENVKDSIWVSHNGLHYDQLIYQDILKNKNPYQTSKAIIDGSFKGKSYLDMIEFDCMKVRRTPFSLKLTELISGRSIEMTEVDFDLPRELNLDEKDLTEKYNKADLEQTLYNFEKFYSQFELRLNIGKTFDIPIKDALKLTEAQLAARVLGAKADSTLKYNVVKPQIWSTLKIKNKEIINWYLNEEYMKRNILVNICGAEHTLGKGGIHAALNKVHYKKVLYYDVSGYYNLCMLNIGLLPRTLTEAGKTRYRDMYHSQLEMKKDPNKANARKAYKTILLSVFGAMNNEYGDFYDPYHFYLVTLSGQLYIIDLLEKLEGLVQVVQSNTDGIMIVPFNWDDEEKIDQIVKEWEDRTGFNMEKGYLYNLWQRDVNCYFALDEKNNVDYKGDVINYITDDKAYGACKLFDASNPPIIAKGTIDYLLFDTLPEVTVDKYKNDLRNFQYQCKKGTFDYMTCDKILLIPKGKKFIEETIDSEKVKPLNRVFAANIGYIDDYVLITRLIKHKDPTKKGASVVKVPNLPESVFIYNENIDNPSEELKSKINWQYYIEAIYDKILEFIPEEK